MRNELVKAEVHICPRIRLAEERAVYVTDERQVQLAVAPGIAELIGSRRNGRKGGGGL